VIDITMVFTMPRDAVMSQRKIEVEEHPLHLLELRREAERTIAHRLDRIPDRRVRNLRVEIDGHLRESPGGRIARGGKQRPVVHGRKQLRRTAADPPCAEFCCRRQRDDHRLDTHRTRRAPQPDAPDYQRVTNRPLSVKETADEPPGNLVRLLPENPGPVFPVQERINPHTLQPLNNRFPPVHEYVAERAVDRRNPD
jgi:hypothetical protein